MPWPRHRIGNGTDQPRQIPGLFPLAIITMSRRAHSRNTPCWTGTTDRQRRSRSPASPPCIQAVGGPRTHQENCSRSMSSVQPPAERPLARFGLALMLAPLGMLLLPLGERLSRRCAPRRTRGRNRAPAPRRVEHDLMDEDHVASSSRATAAAIAFDAVVRQLVGDHHTSRLAALTFHRPALQAYQSLLVVPALDQNVKHDACARRWPSAHLVYACRETAAILPPVAHHSAAITEA
jgi:hypothetical protein